MLATAIDEKEEWEECLPKVCLAYNTSEHSATGFSPFYMMFGRQANMPLDIIYGTPTSTSKDCAHYTTELKKALEQAYRVARQNMGTAAARQKELRPQDSWREVYGWTTGVAMQPSGAKRELSQTSYSMGWALQGSKMYIRNSVQNPGL